MGTSRLTGKSWSVGPLDKISPVDLENHRSPKGDSNLARHASKPFESGSARQALVVMFLIVFITY